MRKLVSIQRIKNIQPIEGADNIVKANILGWNVVTKNQKQGYLNKKFKWQEIIQMLKDTFINVYHPMVKYI